MSRPFAPRLFLATAMLLASACVEPQVKPVRDARAPSLEDPRLRPAVRIAPGLRFEHALAPTEEAPPLDAPDPGTSWLRVTVASWSGTPLQDAEVCTIEGCELIDGRFGEVTLPDGEVMVTVRGEGTVERHVPLVGGGQAYVSVPSIAEADALAAAFGVERTPGLGTVVQFVDLPAGLRPELSVAADGPFVTDGRLQPVVGTDTVSFGYYVFFNVAPGLHRVELPGCDEGSTFWGPPSDGAIDIEVSPDAWLGLMPALCGF